MFIVTLIIINIQTCIMWPNRSIINIGFTDTSTSPYGYIDRSIAF